MNIYIRYAITILIILQTTKLPAQTAIQKIKSVEVGDSIPDALWNLPLNIVNHQDGNSTLTLESYKDKLIVLDFWATWCVPCIEALEKIDIVQRSRKDIFVLPVSFEDKKKIEFFISKRNWNLLSVVNDVNLSSYFPHSIVPHQIWIYNGVVMAITSDKEFTTENINNIILGEKVNIITKKDVMDYNLETSITKYALEQGNINYFSANFTTYLSGFPSGNTKFKDEKKQIIAFANRPAVEMYAGVLNLNNNKIVFKTNNPDKFVNPDNIQNLYCYQIFASNDYNEGVLQKKMISDFDNYFNLKSSFRRLDKTVYVIESNGDNVGNNLVDTANSKKKRLYSITQIVDRFNSSRKWSKDLPVFVDESSYSKKIPLNKLADIDSLNDINAIENFMSQFQLRLVKQTRKMEFLVIEEVKM